MLYYCFTLYLDVLIHVYETCRGCVHSTSVQHFSVSSTQTALQKPTLMTSCSRHNAAGPAEWGQCVRSSEYARPPRAQQQRWVQSQTNHSLRLSLALCLKEPNKMTHFVAQIQDAGSAATKEINMEHWKYEGKWGQGGKSTALRAPVYWVCYKQNMKVGHSTVNKTIQ